MTQRGYVKPILIRYAVIIYIAFFVDDSLPVLPDFGYHIFFVSIQIRWSLNFVWNLCVSMLNIWYCRTKFTALQCAGYHIHGV